MRESAWTQEAGLSVRSCRGLARAASQSAGDCVRQLVDRDLLIEIHVGGAAGGDAAAARRADVDAFTGSAAMRSAALHAGCARAGVHDSLSIHAGADRWRAIHLATAAREIRIGEAERIIGVGQKGRSR